MSGAAAMAVVAALTSTAQVEDLAVADGQVVAATRGGAVLHTLDGDVIDTLPGVETTVAGFVFGDPVVGTPLGAWRWGPRGWERVGPRRPVVGVADDRVLYADAFDEPVVAAVRFEGLELGFTADGRVIGDLAHALPGPVADVAVVDGELRVACHLAAATFDGTRWVHHRVPAVAAGAAWATADGLLVDRDGARLAQVGAGVTAVARGVDGWLVGTDDGLLALGVGVARWQDPEAMPCRPFVTGLTLHEGLLVVGTFDGGACRLAPGGWQVLDLPSPLVNEVLSDGTSLWVATSEGLVRDGEVIGVAPDGAARHAPGLHHEAVADLSLAPDGQLWAADVLGPVQVEPWRRHRWGVSGHSHTSVAACADGTVWAGTEDDGLAVRGRPLGRRNGRSGWWHVSRFDGLPEDWVMDVACAGDGAAFVGTYRHGVGRVDAAGWHPVGPEVWTQVLLVEGDVLWVGHADGLLRIEGDDVREVLPERDVHALLRDGDRLWVGTRAGVLGLSEVARRPRPSTP